MKQSVPSPPRRLSRSYSGQWVNGDLQAAVLLIFVAGFLLIVAVESFYNDLFRRAPATMIPCGPELPTAMALLRARAASQLFAGGMLALMVLGGMWLVPRPVVPHRHRARRRPARLGPARHAPSVRAAVQTCIEPRVQISRARF